MAGKSSVKVIPFDDKGNLVDYVHTARQADFEWRPNEPFKATLRMEGARRGYSAANFHFINVETGGGATIFMSGIAKMIAEFGIPSGGLITGWWRGCKHGLNYGLVYLGPKPPETK